MLLIGHNTKKKYWPKSPLLKTPPKMPKNANFVASFDDFLTLLCHFDGLHSAENLGGSAQTFHIFLFKIWEKTTFFSQECKELLAFGISQTPSNASRMPGGVVKTQILPKICCQILHLCTSYSNKTGFTHCEMGKLKCQQFSTMVWPTSEPSTVP